jgi:hypothetical protein
MLILYSANCITCSINISSNLPYLHKSRFIGKELEKKRSLGRTKCRWKDNITMNLKRNIVWTKDGCLVGHSAL